MKIEIDKDDLRWIIRIIYEKIGSVETDIDELLLSKEIKEYKEAAERLKEYKKGLEDLKQKLQKQLPQLEEHIT